MPPFAFAQNHLGDFLQCQIAEPVCITPIGCTAHQQTAGFAYVIAGVGLWMRRRWATWLAMAIAVATALVFLAFGVHVALGGAWERRTVIAMTLRTLVWVGIAAIAWRRSTANAPATREQ